MNKHVSLKRAVALLMTMFGAVALLSAGAELAPQANAAPAVLTQTKDETAYVTIHPAADGSFWGIALTLKFEGTAEFKQALNGDGKVVSETGTWKDNGDDTLTVTLSEEDGQKVAAPQVMTFQREGTQITLMNHDKAVWGEEGLKLNLATEVARKLRTPLVALDVSAGFPLDPTFVSVNGGGAVDARLLGSDCSGYINSQPVVTVKWAGEADLVRAFFYSDGDPTLVVLTPKGKLLCNAYAHGQLLDPVIEIEKPEEGLYRIWIGSTAKDQLVPGLLVLTTKPDMDLGTFDVHKLITRPAIPQKAASSGKALKLGAQAQAEFDKLVAAAPTLGPGANVTIDTTADGILPLFRLPEAADRGCAGLITGAPNYVFKWGG